MDSQKTPGKRTHSYSSVNGYSLNSNLESFSASRFENSHSSIEKLTNLEAELQEVKKICVGYKEYARLYELVKEKTKVNGSRLGSKGKRKSVNLLQGLKAKRNASGNSDNCNY